MTTTTNVVRELERVPGVLLLIASRTDVKIVWPNGKTTKMRWFPLFDREHYEAYTRQPLRLSRNDRARAHRS